MKIRGRLFVRNHGTIIIGQNCRVNGNLASNPVGGPYPSSIIADKHAKIIIGDYVGISGTAIVSSKEIVIESHVMIGSGCCIYDTDFHSIHYEKRISEKDDAIGVKPVKICEGAFIGARSIILKGVTIGKHSIIGAGSVVTKSVPDYQLWAGNPAQFIKNIEE